MSWRRVAVIYTLLALLGGYVFVLDRPAPGAPQAGGPLVGPSLLEVDPAAVTEIAFHKEGRTVRVVRQSGRWHALEPEGILIPSDLIDATVATLTNGQSAEHLAEHAEHDLAAYGLDAPSATLDVVLGPAATSPVRISVGARNPTRTAVYARRNDRPTLYLVGMNLSYYIDLIFESPKT